MNPTAHIWPCDIATYHADGANSVSHSELELFAESPELYRGRILTGEYPREESGAFDIGTVLHACVLQEEQPHVVIPREALASDGSRRGKSWLEWKELHPGKIYLKQDEADLVQRMRDAIDLNAAASELLFSDPNGRNELTIKWDCEECGLTRRARIDRLLPGAIVDVKSCKDASPRGFARAAATYGYSRQNPYYGDAVEALTGERPPFFFIAFEKSAPYTVNVFELEEPFVRMGAEQNRADLAALAECRRTGVWLKPNHGEVIRIPAPGMAYADNDWRT